MDSSSTFVCLNHFAGNGTFPSGFPAQEGQNTHSSQTSWSEEQPQESPSTWDTAACVGSKVTTHNTKFRLRALAADLLQLNSIYQRAISSFADYFLN